MSQLAKGTQIVPSSILLINKRTYILPLSMTIESDQCQLSKSGEGEILKEL